MKFVGVMLIIYGVIQAITILGIIIAWIPIWLGVLITSASNRMDAAYNAGDKYSFIEAQMKIGSYFTVFGVLLLIGLVLTVVFVAIALSTGFFTEYMLNIQNSTY
jgi:hypothetical protein